MDVNINLQGRIDKIVDKTILRFIPHSIKPNQITLIRFLLIPLVSYLFFVHNNLLALIVFVVAASTDFIDGAMARTRHQITDLGKIIDPVADKLLILAALVGIGLKFLIIKVFVVFILIELAGIVLDGLFTFKIGKVMGANFYGKIKMVLQSVAVITFLIGFLLHNVLIIKISEDILILALVFAVMSSIKQIKLRLAGSREKKA
ncbi:CDP-alcohol phosphatidyltransferase family protein [Candidatus Saccharibacteria bacterium]|nr:CDP-alcohol phosphatidyltransferase family protein [Candidatus Saccharibacteria bacterium]